MRISCHARQSCLLGPEDLEGFGGGLHNKLPKLGIGPRCLLAACYYMKIGQVVCSRCARPRISYSGILSGTVRSL
jgi:hypothetical protein